MNLFALATLQAQLSLIAGKPWKSALPLFSQVADAWLDALVKAAELPEDQVDALHYSYALEERHARRLITGEEIRLQLGLYPDASAFVIASICQSQAPQLESWVLAGIDSVGKPVNEFDKMYTRVAEISAVPAARAWLTAAASESEE